MMPLDNAPGEGGGDGSATEIVCLFVGGVADGLCTKIRADADVVELKRPTHIKPLESKHQAEPEIAKESSKYYIARIALPFNDDIVLVGLGVLDSESPGWALRELYQAYQRDALTKNQSE